jgi:LPS-assembly protein
MLQRQPNNHKNWLIFCKRLGVSFAVLAAAVFAGAPSVAQTLNDRIAGQQGQGKSRMLVDAREVVYDRDKDVVTANGDVQIYYQGKVLEADRVIYNRRTKRVFAEGNAKLTDADGTKTFGDRFDLTDDFRDGFIDSLRVVTPEGARFASPRGERTGGEQTVLDRGTYTTCAPCKDNPERPPLWQVKSARIIHNNSEQRVYYENSTLEFWGVPVAWIPFFSAPDPTVQRSSGILAPRIISKTSLGRGFGLPLYWAIAPNYDLTFTPTYLSRQGLHLDLLWRHRLAHGSYNIRVNGIRQAEPTAFATQPFVGAGSKSWRGSVESRGKFYLNEKWNVGWDVSWASDKHYFTDYKTKPQNFSNLFFSETVSQVYMRGRGERSWFDLTGYHYLGLNAVDWQKQIERVMPSFDFERRFTPDGIGGELRFTYNAAMVQRSASVYQPLPNSQSGSPGLVGNPNYMPTGLLYDGLGGSAGGTYLPCRYVRPGEATAVGSYRKGECLLRGFAGDYVRNTAELSWQRQFIDPIGQEWTPFVSLRTDAAWLRVNTGSLNSPSDAGLGFTNAGTGTRYGNDNQSQFFNGNSRNFMFRVMPTIGVEYRYPFFAQTNWGTHFFEPMAQVLIRPNETRIGSLPNEDAQSLVFDEHSIFQRNKFSGYDRVEGGSRLNYGARYTFKSNGQFFATATFGQSIHLFGRNSYAQYDLANTGRNSGLETRRSDYVAALTVQPVQNAAFTARGRFDDRTLALQRLDLEAVATLGSVSFKGIYTRIAPQPEIGNPLRREGVMVMSSIQLPRNFYASGGVVYDLDRYLSDRAAAISAGNTGYRGSPWRVSGVIAGFGYRDECTDFSISYVRSLNSQLLPTTGGVTQYTRNVTTVMMRLELKDLGEAQLSQRSNR